ncbi:MAG: DUF4190 domain-containing protein [Anaerolineales bacterium]
MNCYAHPDREAAGTCIGCGKFICAECAKTVQDRNYCPACLQTGIPFRNSVSTNALAIASLILGIVSFPTAFCYGCGMIFAVAAIVIGLIARSQIKQSGGRQGGDGLALAGLILGSVVAALVIVGAVCYLLFLLIMILIPAGSDYSMLPFLRGIRFLI